MARKRCLQHYSEPYSWRRRHQAGLQALLEPYGIEVDDENIQLVKGGTAEYINRVTEQIIQATKCSVLAVKPTGFISPVE